jgi:hypothetical protein
MSDLHFHLPTLAIYSRRFSRACALAVPSGLLRLVGAARRLARLPSPAPQCTVPPHEPGRHGWAELLTLVGAVRRLAFDTSLPPTEAMGGIRHAYRDYDRT